MYYALIASPPVLFSVFFFPEKNGPRPPPSKSLEMVGLRCLRQDHVSEELHKPWACEAGKADYT